jgi:site-specific recombinase XerD
MATLPTENLTDDEIRALLRACSRRAPTGIRDRALITVMYRCGLRVSEALALPPHDIDASAGRLTVLRGKGGKRRVVGIGDGALAVIQLWAAERTQLPLTRNSPLFCTLKGTKLSPTQVRAMMKRRAERAGIEKRVHPHALRHANALHLHLERDVPVAVIRDHLGHSNLATTQTYLRKIAPREVLELGREDSWIDA